jgi:hypothetical protein
LITVRDFSAVLGEEISVRAAAAMKEAVAAVL